MSRKYKFRNQEKLYFVSFAVVNWIDVFVRIEYKNVLIESLKYCQKEKEMEIYGWCIMPSHAHLIIGTNKNKLQDIMRDFKSYTSTTLKKEIRENPQESRKEWMLWLMERVGKKNSNNSSFQFWQLHNHPIELNTNDLMQQKLDYIHQNPVEAEFVSEPQHYLYCSALDYSGGKGLLDIIFYDYPIPCTSR